MICCDRSIFPTKNPSGGRVGARATREIRRLFPEECAAGYKLAVSR